MITNDNKGTYLVKNGQKHDNVIYERPLAAPLIAALNYRPLLNRGRKNRGKNNIFWLQVVFE